MGSPLQHASVLIVSDDMEFARSVAARWKAERCVPEITLATSDVWHMGSAAGYQLVIVGPVRGGQPHLILFDLNSSSAAAIYVPPEEKEASVSQAKYPHLLVVPQQDGWREALILVSSEALRRVEAVNRAQRAERLAIESQGYATLGRYMLDMRPSVNNTLTSVLGNADLLLLDPEPVSTACREQIETIHTMALRLSEIMQRFSSLATEMRAVEKESQPETQVTPGGLVRGVGKRRDCS
jgi:signal transduction histidine kinase